MRKYRPFIIGIILGALVVLGVIYVTGGTVLNAREKNYYSGLDKAYGKYYEIIKIIDEEALADYDPDKITDKVLKRMVAGLDDPYAAYYTAEEYSQFERKFAKSYVGVGVTIAEKDKDVVIVSVIKDSPAEEAGLKSGDVVVSVDGDEVKSSDDASSRMAGENGTEVKVTIRRDGKEKTYAINRGKVAMKSVEYTEYDKKNRIGYVRISTFKMGTAKEFRLAVKDLQNAGYDKVIIDLRSNGGGSTEEAYALADLLLPECTILTEVNSRKQKNERRSDESRLDIEYVLLVDGNTASASEMVSGAVKDNKGGKLIGSRTYGKGVTQKTTKFRDGSALKITIEEFFRPSGKAINEVGIEPDIKVDPTDNKAILKAAVKVLK